MAERNKFQKGNTHSAQAGYTRQRRLTGRFIREGLLDYIMQDDPKTGRQRLGHVFSALYRTAKAGGPEGVAAAREIFTRLEGLPVQGIALAAMTGRLEAEEIKMITKDMTSAEAGRIYRDMLKGDGRY